MRKTAEISFTPPEAGIINSVLLDHCISTVDLMNSAQNEVQYNQAVLIMQTSVATQHFFFSQISQNKNEWPESIYLFIRSLVEHAVETLEELKLKMVGAGESIEQLVINGDTLKGILNKLPQQSLIQLP